MSKTWNLSASALWGASSGVDRLAGQATHKGSAFVLVPGLTPSGGVVVARGDTGQVRELLGRTEGVHVGSDLYQQDGSTDGTEPWDAPRRLKQ